MFASHELMLDLSFAAHGDQLSTASDAAYADGLTGLIKVGVATSRCW